jgi:hypothetical protein
MYETIYDLVKSQDLLEANRQLKKIDGALANQEVNSSAFVQLYLWSKR